MVGTIHPPAGASPWIVRPAGGARRLRLFCFSYAGGNASSYLPWQAELDPSIELCAIQLPGRSTRLGEPPVESLPQLIDTLAQVIANHGALPFAFFGHSLGALVAYELARRCQASERAMPVKLIVSGCEAPHCRSTARALHTLPDEQLIDALRDYNGTPPEVLAHRELMELLLPAIRADFGMAETYAFRPAPLLDIPIAVLSGRSDAHIQVARVESWARETTSTCKVHWFEGDHFFIHAEQQAVLACVNAELRISLARGIPEIPPWFA